MTIFWRWCLTLQLMVAGHAFTAPVANAQEYQSLDSITAAAIAAIQEADAGTLFEIMEHSTLKMHAVPVTARPPVIYWNPVTWRVLERFRAVKSTAEHPCGFTMDAGPHVKIFCFAQDAPLLMQALAEIEGVREILESEIGAGPDVRIDQQPVPWTF